MSGLSLVRLQGVPSQAEVEMDLEYIKDASSWDSGGGIALDLIELKDGRVVAISDEAIVVYRNIEDLVVGDPGASRPALHPVD